MPKKGKRRRDVSTVANSPYRSGLPDREFTLLPDFFHSVRAPLTEVADRRLWSPEPILDDLPRTPRQVSSIGPAQPVRKQARRAKRSSLSTAMWARPVMAFNTPELVSVCVRRKRRREVLLALGKGGGGKRRGRRNVFSKVRC